MSDTNRVQLAIRNESTYGVVPSGEYEILRFTGESLAQVTRTARSAEIRSDRQIVNVPRTSVQSAGDVNFELSYGGQDTLLAKALMASAWSSPTVVTGITISASSVDNSFNDSANGFSAFNVGQWVKASSFTNAGNNGYFKIASKPSNGKIIVSGGLLVTESAGSTRTVTQGAQIVNGVTQTSFAVERKYNDLTNVFSILCGMMVNSLSMATAAEAIITGSFGLIGATEASASVAAASSYAAAPGSSVMNAIDDVPKILVNNGVVNATSISLQLSNNLRPRMQIGSVGPVSIGSGTCDVQGTLQQYFTTAALLDLYLTYQSASIAWVHEDGSQQAYVIELPEVRFTDGKRVAGGQNSDVLADLSFMASRDSTEDVTIRIARFV